jgi:predicted nucleotidyltransferase
MLCAEVLKGCKEALEDYYGSRLKGVILFGSMARNKAGPGSDIDLLVLLDKPFDYFRELKQIIDLLYPIQLESERLISAKPAAITDFEQGKVQLYRNIKREGVPV